MFSSWFSSSSLTDDALRAQINGLADEIIKARNSTVPLQNQITQLTQDNSALRLQVSALSSQLAQERASVTSLQVREDSLNATITELKDTIKSLQESCVEMVDLDPDQLIQDIKLSTQRLERFETVNDFEYDIDDVRVLSQRLDFLRNRLILQGEDDKSFYLLNGLELMTMKQLRGATTKMDSNGESGKCALKTRVIDTITRKAETENNSDYTFIFETRHKLTKAVTDYFGEREDFFKEEWDHIFSKV